MPHNIFKIMHFKLGILIFESLTFVLSFQFCQMHQSVEQLYHTNKDQCMVHSLQIEASKNKLSLKIQIIFLKSKGSFINIFIFTYKLRVLN